MQMRDQPTAGERRLQAVLMQRHRDICLLSQVVIGPYIADFYIPNLKLVIEVDGSSHFGREQYDRQRDLYMERKGYRILRFTNTEVFNATEEVVRNIERML